MRSCEVLIVGGGPGGSSCASRLVQAGLDVLVLDRARFPRQKVCAGWVTPPVFASLDVDLDDYRRGRVLQPITATRTGLQGGGGTIETRYDEPVSYGIRRFELDHYLLQRSGARVCLGEPAAAIDWRDGEWIVNGEIRTPMLVGAGGHFCPVARFMGGGGGREPIVAAQEIEIPLRPDEERACRVDPEAPELYFAPDMKGYGWCFRKEGYLNVGYGRQDSVAFARHLRDFVSFLEDEARVPPRALRSWQGHAYLLYADHARPPLRDGAVLVGDAAGLAYAQSGEGIRTAVESGLLAAQTILDADGDYRHDHLLPYGQALEDRYGPTSGGALSHLVPAGWASALGARLLSSSWFTRRVLLDRWFFHRHQAPLVA